jgi:LysM repeat protein
VAVILTFGLLLMPPSLRAVESYTVKKNDTVYSIAKKHGITTARLVQFNALSKPDRIYVGQRLKIPSPSDPASGTALPPSTRASLSKISVKSGQWKYIVIHHSATAVGNVKSMDTYHRETRHMENGLAYHFVIGNGRGMGDGEIAIGNRWRRQLNGGHLASEALNAKSIGICLVGNFDNTKPTKKQMESLEALTDYLLARCNLNKSTVRTHQQINTTSTRCPGRHFPQTEFLKTLKD